MTSDLAIIWFSLGIGGTISVDIFFYTLANASVEKLNFRNWTFPATWSHILLIGLVCGLTLAVGHSFQRLQFPLALLGSAMITRYLYELTQVWRGVDLQFSMTDWMESHFGKSFWLSWIKASILAVSLDCIPVAFGISGQIVDWSTSQLVLGLVVIGVSVAIAAQSSLLVAWLVRALGADASLKTKVLCALGGKLSVLSLLGAFDLLSLGHVFDWHLDGGNLKFYQLLPLTGLVAIIYFIHQGRALWEHQLKDFMTS